MKTFVVNIGTNSKKKKLFDYLDSNNYKTTTNDKYSDIDFEDNPLSDVCVRINSNQKGGCWGNLNFYKTLKENIISVDEFLEINDVSKNRLIKRVLRINSIPDVYTDDQKEILKMNDIIVD